MDTIEIKEWLDKLIEITNNFNNARHFNGQIYAHSLDNMIMIFSGIEIIAGELEMKLQVRNVGGEWPYRNSFYYKGFEIVQYSEEDLSAVSD